MSSEISETNLLDLRGVLCPMNWVRTKLALEELPEGDTLDVILDDGEPMRNVPRSAKGEGHRILQVQEQKDGAYRLTIRSGST
ncbi:MAG: sulfurtransferase TusA family protein [Dehalococcoidia bacterium]|jgi:TusA-related sulfurtransferase|nr:sulfurtransferase TusA family protein [Dehalococcoidia bacterium]MDP7239913.1 sulfurtransferase TusA family protein [Dehalococcoidia bacterium]MDP7469897.1 sulfurtransferase TusA family protein [Dehalococcoidia bacterium]